MIRTTTPYLKFNLKFEVAQIDELRVYFAQGHTVLFVKEKNDCTLEDKSITVRLTQEETKELQTYSSVDVQLKVKIGNDAMASKVYPLRVDRILKDEIL